MYVKLMEEDEVHHWTTDDNFELYLQIRREIPYETHLFNTRRELVASLRDRDFHIDV